MSNALNPAAAQWAENLALLASLGELTADSLNPPELPISTSLLTASLLAAAVVPGEAVTHSPFVASERYQGNLNHPSVQAALIEFHRAHAPTQGIHSSAVIRGPNLPGPAPVKSGFTPAQIPIVDTNLKASADQQRSRMPSPSPVPLSPVLRPRKES